MLIAILLLLSILAGQLIKFPLFGLIGPTLLDISVFLLCLRGLYKLKFKLKKSTLYNTFGLLFILIAVLSLIFTPLHLNTKEYLVSFSYTTRFFIYLLFGWIIYSGAFPEFRKKISSTLIYSGVGIAVLGMLQFVFFPNLTFLEGLGWDPHYFRTVSTFLDPNFAGAFFVLTLVLLYQNLAIANKWNILIYTIVYIALLTTFSRSSYLMFLTSGLIYAILQKSGKTAVFIVVLFLGLLLGFQIYTQLIAQPRGINREQSALYRINTWQDGFSIFGKSPLLGVGFNTYKYAIREYHLANSTFLDSRGATTNDSSLLYVLSTTGMVGLLAFLLFLFSIIKSGIKNNIVLTAAIIGLLCHSFFANSLFYPFILIWINLLAADTKT